MFWKSFCCLFSALAFNFLLSLLDEASWFSCHCWWFLIDCILLTYCFIGSVEGVAVFTACPELPHWSGRCLIAVVPAGITVLQWQKIIFSLLTGLRKCLKMIISRLPWDCLPLIFVFLFILIILYPQFLTAPFSLQAFTREHVCRYQ